jgi:hypothetical protein
MRYLIVVVGLLALVACSQKPGSESWCTSKDDQPKSEWSGDDAMVYAKHCVFDSQTIGSETWCDKLSEKPKGDWTGSEAGDYAKHCVI